MKVKSLVFVLLCISAFVIAKQLDKEIKTYPSVIDKAPDKWVDSVFRSLTLEERIAQMIMPAVYPKDTQNISQQLVNIAKYNIGEYIIFQGGVTTVAQLVNKLQDAARTPLILGMDGEWGLTMRFDSAQMYPKQMMLGAANDTVLIYQMACDIAQQLHRLGLHTNFAPVADINNNPRNPVINSRSFGENRENVTRFAMAYMKGLQDNHILAVAKHFPGHGDTGTDSHLELPFIDKPASVIDSLELYPFKQLIKNGLSSIMTGHINMPSLDTTGKPASLSPIIINGVLKKQLGFGGLIFTDALNMKGAQKKKEKEQIINAVIAGNDVLLMPTNIKDAIDTIKGAIKVGIISEEDINARCKKILKAKVWLGLDKSRQKPSMTNVVADLQQPLYRLLSRYEIEKAITIIHDPKSLLPVKHLDTCHIASISWGCDTSCVFQQTLSLYAPIDEYYVNENTSDSLLTLMYSKLKKYNLVIGSIVNTDMRLSKNYGVTDKTINFFSFLADSAQLVMDIFGSPYLMNRFPENVNFQSILISYDDKKETQTLSAQLIFGAIKAQGTLPVSINEKWRLGTGITWNNTIRVKYTMPEEVGISSQRLALIDSIMNDAIRQKAIPGGVVYIAKDNKVFYHKAFGYYTYDSVQAVSTNTVYDLASITKIAATTPLLMHYYEAGKLKLDDPLGHYLKHFKKKPFKKLLVQDLMTHRSGFKSFSTIYLNGLNCADKSRLLKNEHAVNCSTKLNKVYFANYKDKYYAVEVAKGIYTFKSWNDTVEKEIIKNPLAKNNPYVYSDLNFIMLGKVVENISKSKLDVLSNELFYSKLGAGTLGYLPLKKMDTSKIAPTENDTIFRKQLIQGYVHDPIAAVYGGVCGHAGVFGTANDLGKLMHVFLNKGNYGGDRYFQDSTMNKFNSRLFISSGNRRGLGFDKPEPDTAKQSPVSRYCSDMSFGHAGFTGVMTWVDPQYNLVYVFVSNRVYPSSAKNKLAEMNVRTQIQDIIYKEIIEQKK